jgi:hypothetical protein
MDNRTGKVLDGVLKVRKGEDGYFIEFKDRKLGPFNSLKQVDPLKAAAELNGVNLSFPELLNLSTDTINGWSVKPGDVLRLKLLFDEVTQPLTIEELKKILGTTVKRDDTNKIITFLCMLVAYTEDSQFNISFRAPSSTGKSYLPLEIAYYFPEEDLLIISYSSPTAFFHDSGEWNEGTRTVVVNLERKILIFLDQPHDQLLQRLRPLLSHDQKELTVKITDKSEKKGLRTKNVVLKGFPSVIFCTGSLKIDEQEQTRHILLSPEVSQEKIREALLLKAMRKANPKAFEEFLKQHPEREVLKKRVREIKNAHVRNVIIRDYVKIVERFYSKYPKLKPRHSRDIERLISIIQGLALLNLWHRERDGEGNIYASDGDIETGFQLYDEICESQELGIPPYIYNFFNDIIKPLFIEANKHLLETEKQKKEEEAQPIGITSKEILKKHYEVYGRLLPEWQLRREILPALEDAGLVYLEPDPNDKRRNLIFCTPPPSGLYILLRQPTLDQTKNIETKRWGSADANQNIETGQWGNAKDSGSGDTKDEPKPEQPSKLYRCKTCKCGLWKTLEMAKEHARLMPGHEIEEVEG